MTKKQAEKLTQEIALEYLGKDWNDKLTKIQAELWTESFQQLNYDGSRKSIKAMFNAFPSSDNPFNWRMPYFDTLLGFYKGITTPKRDYCPCCAGTGWIYFETTDGVVRCDCSSPEIDMGKYTKTVKTLDQIFPNYPEAKCDSFQCDPRKDSPCPMGTQFYNAKKIEFMDRIKQTPGWKLGLTFHKPGGFVENVVKAMDSIDEE